MKQAARNIFSWAWLFLLLTFSLQAQEGKEMKRWRITVGAGINGNGPANEVADLMIDHGFDKTLLGFFGTSHHPHYAQLGLTAALGLSRSIHEKWSVGVTMQYADLREVFGYSYEDGYLFIDLKQLSFTTALNFNSGKYFDFWLGPTIMTNRAWTSSEGGPPGEDYQRLTVGFAGGIDLKIWDRQKSVLKLGLSYLMSTNTKVGPFTSWYINQAYTIPESSINFSALHAVLTFGFKWD